jgi:hypothetical protein
LILQSAKLHGRLHPGPRRGLGKSD